MQRPRKKSLSAKCGRRAAQPGAGADETIFLVDEVIRKRTSAPIAPIKQRGSIMYRAETGGFP